MNLRVMSALLIVGLWATACRSTESAAPESASSPPSDLESTDYSAQPAEAEAAREAFASELGVPPQEVQVVSVEPVTWNDSALGCEEPGQSYLMVLTPGYKVTLEHQGKTTVYHTDRTDGSRPPNIAECAGRTTGAFEPVEVPPLRTLAAAAIDAARIDLEERVPPGAELQLEDIQPSDVTDLVCGDPSEVAAGTGPAKVIIELHLRAGAEVHVYRSWKDEVLYCGLLPGPATE